MKRVYYLFFLGCILNYYTSFAQDISVIVNDVTGMNPIRVTGVIKPTTTAEIVEAVKNNQGPVSIAGGHYSQGGQTATDNALQIDMRSFNKIISFSKEKKEITVQAGITWRKVQEYIDSFGLSVKIMQTYNNFTVGGALSVNCHGRYNGQGPIISSVKQIQLILADGSLVTASPSENPDIFYGTIGGYGGLGVITEVTLSLTNDCKVVRRDTMLSIKNYKKFYFDKIRSDTSVIFHNADIYPDKYEKVRVVSYDETNENVTVPYRLKPSKEVYHFNRFAFRIISCGSFGKWVRQHIIDPLTYKGHVVEWRNYEASYDVNELEPRSRKKSTYVLQEYFIPVDSFDAFYPKMVKIFRQNKVNVINISIRHANKDPGSLMAWARTEVFAFVIYYKQGTGIRDEEQVKKWTGFLLDAAITCGGDYYLPYQVIASPQQFAEAYPTAINYFQLKKRLDPTGKFTNKLWDAYYK